ncbi:hypothetical protein C9926_02140 [Sulfurovum lithotrophicum]|nr:hypothetical protein C9926_02140 [Sulfurovum lithotrophicum]
MNEEEKNLFDAKLENNSNSITAQSCPSSEPSTIKNMLRLITITLIIGAIGTALGLFVSGSFLNTLHHIENYLMLFVLFSIVVYIFVAKYEGKKYSHCTSCQIGNILGTAFIQSIRLGLLAVTNYFVFS